MKNNLIPSCQRWKRYSCFLIISVFFTLITLPSDLFAAEAFEQPYLTLQAENKTIKEVLSYIESNSEFVFLYSKELAIQLNKKVSVSADNKKVTDILSEALKNTGLTYKISERQITIVKTKTEASINQQVNKVKVTGRVLDEMGESVPGASIFVKGDQSTGTITDLDGNFTITVPENVTLVASFIGYLQNEVPLKGKKDIVFRLVADSKQLEEVVVVGFGTQKKASVVGAVQTLKPAELRVPSSSLSNSFGGRIAGVISMQRSGEPGADGANFWIRGAATFSGSTSPLIFIDGVEVSAGDMNAIPSEAIENFSILKDASATALYGARGANGVVLITTRTGKEMDKPRISVRIDNTFTAPTRSLQMADAVTNMKLKNEAILTRNPEGTPSFTDDKILGTIEGRNQYVYPNVNWSEYMFKDFSMNQS